MAPSVRWLIIAGFSAALLLGSCKNGSSKPQVASFDVLDDLKPDTTLHVTNIHFQRHGPAEDTLKLSESYQPETVHSETWITFGENGNAESVRGETRDEDGKLYGSSRSDGEDIVYEDARGETQRIPGQLKGMTVETIKKAYADAQNQSLVLLEQHPDAPAVQIGLMATRVIETQRGPYARPVEDVTPGNYMSVYVFDLQPVEELRRSYISEEGVGLRSEMAVVDANGEETIVERSETVYEVLRG